MEMTEKDKIVQEIVNKIISLIDTYNCKADFRGYEVYGILESVKHAYMVSLAKELTK